VEVDVENTPCTALGLRGGVSSESFALTLLVPAAATRSCVVSLFGGAGRGATSTTLWWVLALREKSLAPRSRAGDGGGYVVTFMEASSWRPCSAFGVCFSRRQVRGCQGSGPEQMMFVCRGGGLENHGGQLLLGCGSCLHGLVDNLVSLGWRDCRLGRCVSRRRFDF
jgi:hypothetical protein